MLGKLIKKSYTKLIAEKERSYAYNIESNKGKNDVNADRLINIFSEYKTLKERSNINIEGESNYVRIGLLAKPNDSKKKKYLYVLTDTKELGILLRSSRTGIMKFSPIKREATNEEIEKAALSLIETKLSLYFEIVIKESQERNKKQFEEVFIEETEIILNEMDEIEEEKLVNLITDLSQSIKLLENLNKKFKRVIKLKDGRYINTFGSEHFLASEEGKRDDLAVDLYNGDILKYEIGFDCLPLWYKPTESQMRAASRAILDTLIDYMRCVNY